MLSPLTNPQVVDIQVVNEIIVLSSEQNSTPTQDTTRMMTKGEVGKSKSHLNVTTLSQDTGSNANQMSPKLDDRIKIF